MKIVIAGAGEVGTHLAKMLSRENHDIVVIEEDREKVQNIEKLYDLIAVQGICTALQDLKEAGTKDADLFIGVTPIESRNITSCILAHKLGAKKTVARINNYEYLLEENQKFFNDLGIDALIYPELLAAKEITASIKMNWVRQWMEFSNGALTLIGMKIRANAPIINQKLMNLKNSEFYRVVSIRRNSETIIPKGADEIKANDIVYFITTKDYIPDVRKQAGKEVIQVKDLMIVGGGNITMKTIQSMPDNMDVKVLEKDKQKVNALMEKTDNAMIINVDTSDLDVLRDENI